MWMRRTSRGRRDFPLSWSEVEGTWGGRVVVAGIGPAVVVVVVVVVVVALAWACEVDGAEAPFAWPESPGGVTGGGAEACVWLGDAMVGD
jgi:hypothetical protein